MSDVHVVYEGSATDVHTWGVLLPGVHGCDMMGFCAHCVLCPALPPLYTTKHTAGVLKAAGAGSLALCVDIVENTRERVRLTCRCLMLLIYWIALVLSVMRTGRVVVAARSGLAVA